MSLTSFPPLRQPCVCVRASRMPSLTLDRDTLQGPALPHPASSTSHRAMQGADRPPVRPISRS
jgi:hypothetical protein